MTPALSRRALVVEDEPLIRMGVVDICETAGMLAEEASNADEAFRILLSGRSFALLLTDIDMPGSMDGIALAWRAREVDPNITVVVVSGKMIAPQAALPAGSLFFAKPVQEGKLVSTIAELVEQR